VFHGAEIGMVVELDRDAVRQGIEAGELLVIDVREPHEFAIGHIPGSVLMPLSSFDPAALPVDDDRAIVFSCAAGVRSLHAIRLAQAAGDTHYVGGFKDWLMAGFPVEQE
jgi:rhodanese-related sulfurtransferase